MSSIIFLKSRYASSGFVHSIRGFDSRLLWWLQWTLAWTWPQLSPKRAINCSFNRALGAGAGWHRVNGLKSWWELSTPPPKYFEIYPEDKNDLPPHSKHWISFYGLRLKLVFIVPYNSLVLNKQNLVCVTQRAPGAGYVTVLPALAVTISHSARALRPHTWSELLTIKLLIFISS